jgi:hypothetical protein
MKQDWILWSGTFMGYLVDNDPTPMWFSSEVWFISVDANYLLERFTALIHDVPLHDVTVGVWFSMSATRIIGPFLGGGRGGGPQIHTEILRAICRYFFITCPVTRQPMHFFKKTGTSSQNKQFCISFTKCSSWQNNNQRIVASLFAGSESA